MKRKLLFILSISTVIAVLLNLNGCRKTDRDSDEETQSAIDNSAAQILFNDVFKQIDQYADTNKLLKLAAAPCDTSWVTGTVFPKTLTIKYDSLTGCTDPIGMKHKGKIKAIFTGLLSDSLSVITVYFDNLYIQGYQISGAQTITNKGYINGAYTFSMNVSNARITTPAGKKINWNAQLTYKVIAGNTTSTYKDDVLSITGTSSGSNISGTSFTATITSAIRYELSCRYLSGGILTITPGNLAPRTLDYGSGCDNTGTVTLTGNKSFSISLL